MAQDGVVLNKDQFSCPICLDVLKDPVTIPCGHSYCSACIQLYWDQHFWEWDCPQCRQTFNDRPQPGRNIMLADVVDKFKNMGLQETSEPKILSLAGSEDVACDVCTGRKGKAVRSCLVCLVSYCEAHLQPHCKSPAFNSHKLVPASKNLQEMICRHHNKLLEVYCRTDKQFICYLCLTDEHKGHNTVLAETEVQEKQADLKKIKKNSQQRIQEMENEERKLHQASSSFSRSTRAAIEECDKMFTALIHSIEVNRFDLRELIRGQEKTAGGQAEEVLKKLQKEITELKNRDAELEKLSQTEDHIHFLQSCQSLHPPPVLEVPSVNTDTGFIFGPLMASVSSFKNMLQDACQGGFYRIYDKVREVTIIQSPTPSTQQKQQGLAQSNEHTNVPMHSTLVIPGQSSFQVSLQSRSVFIPGPTLSKSRSSSIVSSSRQSSRKQGRKGGFRAATWHSHLRCTADPTPSTQQKQQELAQSNEHTNVPMHSTLVIPGQSSFKVSLQSRSVFIPGPTLSKSRSSSIVSSSRQSSRKQGRKGGFRAATWHSHLRCTADPTDMSESVSGPLSE